MRDDEPTWAASCTFPKCMCPIGCIAWQQENQRAMTPPDRHPSYTPDCSGSATDPRTNKEPK